ncbi:MAG: peptide/nickel transport system permease protein [Gaiellaceae bacterium]|nr:peptide/nickel transport system permease protein [Gaiellaceae bacterium]
MGGAIAGEVPVRAGDLAAVGGSPWAIARRRLRRNRIAMTMAGVLALIVVLCLAAPLYAKHLAHTDPFHSNLDGKTIVSGKSVSVMQESSTGLGLGVTPIGPTWDLHHYFLGADDQGRDVAARLLYGGRNSLLIGVAAALLTCIVATIVGLLAGFFGGLVDGVLSRVLDVVWAFPVYLLAISLSTVLIARGFSWGPFHLESGSLLLPIVIIGVVYIPYVARPIRGEVMSLRQLEFVEAAIGLGASTWRLLWSDILRNVVTTVIVFFPLMLAIDMLTEAALSFLSIGVQPPNASWGTIILDGQGLLYTRPAVALAPGIAIAITVLALNVLGDGIRDALDPRAKLRRID